MDKKNKIFKEDVSIVLCGKAGQGIKTIELILVHVLKKSGYNVFSTKEYMSRIRGGSNSTLIRVSDKNVKSMKKKIDILFPLDSMAIAHVADRISENTVILGDKDLLKDDDHEIIDIPFVKTAKEIGSTIYQNIVACGAVLALFNSDLDLLNEYITNKFEKKGDDIVNNNIEAAKKGAVGFMMRSVSTSHHRFAHTGASQYKEGVEQIVKVAIPNPDADQISRLTALNKTVKVNIKVQSEDLGEGTSYNVIGQINGTQNPEQ